MDCKQTGAYLFINQTAKAEQSQHSIFYGCIRVYYLVAYRCLTLYGAAINEEMSAPVVLGDLHCSPQKFTMKFLALLTVCAIGALQIDAYAGK